MNRSFRHLGSHFRAAALSLSLLVGLVRAAPVAPRPVAGDATASSESAQAKAKLAAVRARIAALTGKLSADLKQRDALNARLRETELGITTARLRLDELRAAQLAAGRRRADLRAEQTSTEAALGAQRSVLAAEVRAAYMIGAQEKMKLLLNQDDPAGAGRALSYYGYFARERSVKIDAIRVQVERLGELTVQIDVSTSKLRALAGEAAVQMQELERARGARSTALAAVTKQVDNGQEELAKLKREEQLVESLVADLSRVLQDYPVDSQRSFAALRGKLEWPVPGRIAARYQDARGSGGSAAVRWNGVMIEASRGAKVRSPYFGRVVYADWLPGLGLLLIVGHSGDYMTLYGHAEVLYKSVGDWVAAGDVIAALPDAGALPQLYFEIREGRKTVDPKLWLKIAP